MNVALILSGGTGTRLGLDIPKQYIEICGKPVISYCLEALSSHDRIDFIHIVAEPVWQNKIELWLSESDSGKKFKKFSIPGANRQLSILNGLSDIRQYAGDSDYILIHDAARPMISQKQIADCLDAAKEYDGVVPVLPMKDTVYSSKNGKTITGLLQRNEIYAGQAPEVFKLGVYYAANLSLLPDEILNINGSTEPAVLAGLKVAMIPGDENNFKITTKTDLKKFRKLVES